MSNLSNTKPSWRLGLDLGTNSIGFCATSLDENGEPNGVLWTGTRLFANGREPKTGISLAEGRRNARSVRRQRDRKKRAQKKLVNALTRYGLFPTNEADRQKLKDINPLECRAKGLDEALTLHELGRAIFHLHIRRGFKSNRKDSTAKSEGNMQQAMDATMAAIEEAGHRTLGEYLFKERFEKKDENGNVLSTRFKGHSAKNDKGQAKNEYEIYATRQMIENEFDALWASQKRFYPQQLGDEAREAIREIVFFQRPLKAPQVGQCIYLRNETRNGYYTASHAILKLLSDINNLKVKITDENHKRENRHLTIAERQKALNWLITSNRGEFKTLRNKIWGTKNAGLSYLFGIESERRTSLGANSFADIYKLLGNKLPINFETQHPTEIISTIRKYDEILDLIAGDGDDEDILDILKTKYGYDSVLAEQLLNLPISNGYSQVGRTIEYHITETLLTPLVELNTISIREDEQGRKFPTYADAIKHLYRVGVIPQSTKTSTIYDKLPYYGEIVHEYTAPVALGSGSKNRDEELYGKIGNPTVHVALNQLRKVVNALIKKFGKPESIIVELARELKLSKKAKASIAKQQGLNQKLNEEATKEILKYKAYATRADIEKYKLFKELQEAFDGIAVDVYTGQTLSINQLFSGAYQVDHILPNAQSLDNSYGNKILTTFQANQHKGNRSPYEAFAHDSRYNWEQILNRAEKLGEYKYSKFSETAMDERKDNIGFLARQLHDTAYISRVAKQYLEALYNEEKNFGKPGEKQKVFIIKGRQTALIRQRLGLNTILKDDEPENAVKGDLEAKSVDMESSVAKNTDEGVNVAIEASEVSANYTDVVEETTAETVEATRTVETSVAKPALEEKPKAKPKPAKNRNDHRHHAIDAFVISISTPKYLEKIGKYFAQTRNSENRDISFPEPWNHARHDLVEKIEKTIVSRKPDHGIEGQLHEETARRIEAETETGIKLPGNKTFSDKSMYYLKPLHNPNKKKDTPNKSAVYTLGSNYCAELYENEKGKWASEVITTFVANSKEYKEFMNSPRYKTHTFGGRELIQRIRKGDYIEIDNKDMGYVGGVESDGRVLILDSQSLTYDKNGKPTPRQVFRGAPSSLQQNNPRFLHIDEIGQIREK